MSNGAKTGMTTLLVMWGVCTRTITFGNPSIFFTFFRTQHSCVGSRGWKGNLTIFKLYLKYW